MKRLHRSDLFSWSTFDESRDVDFNSYAWVRPEGNILIDPLPMSSHDLAHLHRLGGAHSIVITNSDHVRATLDLVQVFGARVYGPAGERENFPLACHGWVGDEDEIVPGLRAIAMEGSKTPGELALMLDEGTLITGDLVRAHVAGSLMMLPTPKLKDLAQARESVRTLAQLPGVEAVLVGDGWPVFRGGGILLRELAAKLGG